MALPLVITLCSGAISAYVAVEIARVNAKLDVVSTDVQRVETSTNTHTDKLVEATDKASRAAGKAEEAAATLLRDKASASAVKQMRLSDAQALIQAASAAATTKAAKAAGEAVAKQRLSLDEATRQREIEMEAQRLIEAEKERRRKQGWSP